jgi:hypothetical protein
MAGSFFRRLRRGQPIVVVSGLPRSGTSMAMRMLEAGGLPLLIDSVRPADASNPHGYYELEAVKGLDKPGDHAWLSAARGKGVKIISFLLTHLPESFDYRVVFMQRDLEEIVASQDKMLAARGEAQGASGQHLVALYTEHLARLDRFLAQRSCFAVLQMEYGKVLSDPEGEADRLNAFVGGTLDVARMATVAEPRLYRNRRSSL